MGVVGGVEMRWGGVEQMSMSKAMYELNKAVPEMNLRDVDACLHWMNTEMKGEWKGAQKKLWGRLKRREEELLGKKVGSGLVRHGGVKALSVDEAKLLDETRRLRQKLREAGLNPDEAVA